MSTEQRAAFIDLIEQAMMSGFMQINANKARIMSAHSGATDQSGGDLLRVALDGYAESFLDIRSDLASAVLEATA